MRDYREFSEEELRELVSAAREELHSWIASIPPEAHDGQPNEHRLFSDLCDAVEALSSANGHLEFNADVNSGTLRRLSAENTALQQQVGDLEKERDEVSRQRDAVVTHLDRAELERSNYRKAALNNLGDIGRLRTQLTDVVRAGDNMALWCGDGSIPDVRSTWSEVTKDVPR